MFFIWKLPCKTIFSPFVRHSMVPCWEEWF